MPQVHQPCTAPRHNDPARIDDQPTADHYPIEIDVRIPGPIVIITKVFHQLNVSVLLEHDLGHVMGPVDRVQWTNVNLYRVLLVVVLKVCNVVLGSVDVLDAGDAQRLTGSMKCKVDVV